MDDSRVKDIGSLLRAFFDEDKVRQGNQYVEFFSSWKSIVGPREASHSRVAEIEKGILVIEAEHPGWIQLLQLRQSAILATVQTRFPELGLRGIAFRLQKDCMSVPVRPKGQGSPATGGAGVGPGPEAEAGVGGETADDEAQGDAGAETGRRSISLDSITDEALRARLMDLKKAMDEDGKPEKK